MNYEAWTTVLVSLVALLASAATAVQWYAEKNDGRWPPLPRRRPARRAPLGDVPPLPHGRFDFAHRGEWVETPERGLHASTHDALGFGVRVVRDQGTGDLYAVDGLRWTACTKVRICGPVPGPGEASATRRLRDSIDLSGRVGPRTPPKPRFGGVPGGVPGG